MKTYGIIPKSLKAACERHSDKVSEIGNEGSDGYWIYCAPGWWNPLNESSAIHEFTVADCISQLSSLELAEEIGWFDGNIKMTRYVSREELPKLAGKMTFWRIQI